MHSSWVTEGFNLPKKIRVVKPWKETSFSRTINWWKPKQTSSPSHQHLKFASKNKSWQHTLLVAWFTLNTKVCIGFHVNPKKDRILVLPRVYHYSLSILNSFCRTGCLWCVLLGELPSHDQILWLWYSLPFSEVPQWPG